MKAKYGLFAFIIVLLLMPLGHTLMVLTEELFPNSMFVSAGVLGFLGLGLLIWGTLINHNKWGATILGLLAGVLVWTGWIEFSFVWIARKLEVPPLMENGEIATKPEYLIMMSSIGLLATFGLMFFFSKTNCQFFNWFQRVFKLRSVISFKEGHEKPMALITFIELVMIVWTFYIVLLLVYDKDIAGDRHPLTYLVAFGSLFWSVYLFVQLIKIQKLDYAIRYAIPTVVIFWNFVEILGRWDMFKEIWVHPTEHWLEVSLIAACLVLFVALYVRESLVWGRQKRMAVNRGTLES